jgi:aspartate/methionine/tyrosine aminotransferase
MSDEVWADIVYTPHTATASLGPEIAQRTFSIMGFSKSYGLAGLRLGVLVSPTSQIQQTMLHLAHADETAYGVSTMSQIAGIAAYQQAQDWLAHFVAHLQTQRDYALTRLNAMPGIECHTPEGTFVLFPNVSAYGLEASTLADYLQQQHGLAVVPGSPQFFGPAAQGHLRLSYATSREILAQGLDRLEHGLAALR